VLDAAFVDAGAGPVVVDLTDVTLTVRHHDGAGTEIVLLSDVAAPGARSPSRGETVTLRGGGSADV
jgi:hypothetical protein